MNDSRFDTVYGQLRNAYAMIIAHEVLLRLVVVKLQESDPQFAASVRADLDRTLGRMSESRGRLLRADPRSWIQEQRLGLVKRRSMMRIMARRTKAATVRA